MSKIAPLVICVGSLIMDMLPGRYGARLAEQECFIPAPGGAAGNVAVATAHMGVGSAIVAKLGKDAFGRHIRDTLDKEGVNTINAVFDSYYRTTMNLHAILPDGSIEYLFYRNPGADTQLHFNELELNSFRDARIVHFDSLAFTDDPFRSACMELIEYCKERNITVTLDGNYRDAVWDKANWNLMIWEILKYFDIVKINMAELELLCPVHSMETAMTKIAEAGVKIILVTDGEKGSKALYKNRLFNSGGFKVDVADTIGCGDAFMGAFLAYISNSERGEFLNMDDEVLVEALSVSNAAAALTATKTGAMPAIPVKEEVLRLISWLN